MPAGPPSSFSCVTRQSHLPCWREVARIVVSRPPRFSAGFRCARELLVKPAIVTRYYQRIPTTFRRRLHTVPTTYKPGSRIALLSGGDDDGSIPATGDAVLAIRCTAVS